MNYQELRNFLLEQMKMTFIYQPVVIRTLLENEGYVSVRRIASECLAYDEAQVEYYIKIVRRYPRQVLTSHGVIIDEGSHFKLSVDFRSLTSEQIQALIEICNIKIRQYIQNYAGIIGDHRYNPEELSSSSINQWCRLETKVSNTGTKRVVRMKLTVQTNQNVEHSSSIG